MGNGFETNKQEKASIFGGIHTRNGKWFMRFDQNDLGAEIPENMAHRVSTALWIQNQYDEGKSPNAEKIYKGTNCHKAALYVAGLMPDLSHTQTKESYSRSTLPKERFKKFQHISDLVQHLRASCNDKPGLVQMISGVPRDEALSFHSFITAFDKSGRPVCFEKVNYPGPFQIVPLERIQEIEIYRNDSWGAASIESLVGAR